MGMTKLTEHGVPITQARDTAIDVLRAGCILYIVGYWHLVPYTEAFPAYANSVTECLKDIAFGTFVFCSGLLLAGRRIVLDRASIAAFYLRRVIFHWSIGLYFPVDGFARLAYLLAVVLPATVVIGYYTQLVYDRGVRRLSRGGDMAGTKRST